MIAEKVTQRSNNTRLQAGGKPFQPGDPRINRAGRIDGGRRGIVEAAKKILQEPTKYRGKTMTKEEALIEAHITRGLKGNVNSARFVVEYAYGRPMQRTEITGGEEGGYAAYFEKPSEAEIRAVEERLLAQVGNREPDPDID